VLFTPNFAPRSEYEFGLERGVRVTLDNLYPLKMWPEVFARREIFVRIDPGVGRGHHQHVRTAGALEIRRAAVRGGRAGRAWRGRPACASPACTRTPAAASSMSPIGPRPGRCSGTWRVAFPTCPVVDLGGGIGVPEQTGAAASIWVALDAGVAQLAQALSAHRVLDGARPLPGGQGGVLVAQVTQLKGKGDVQYVGIATGMNSLIRPALYGAHHDIRNLTRLEEPPTERVNVVGPICETADVLGYRPPGCRRRSKATCCCSRLRRLWLCDGVEL
jgi:bifunctional diaminopimelate decarboxylase / aspartate kinase